MNTLSIPKDEQVLYSAVALAEAERLRTISDIQDIAEATKSESALRLAKAVAISAPFPSPKWLMSRFDSQAEWDIYRYIGSVRGKTLLQLGGSGLMAAMFAHLGAEKCYLVTPVSEETEVGRELARLARVNVDCRTGFAERIPFPNESFDIVYSGGCAHHFNTAQAFPEIFRVLRKGGVFAAVEPWKAPLHVIGTRIFGKREEEVHCRPLDGERMRPFFDYFPDGRVTHHAPLSRYFMLALCKLGLQVPFDTAFKVMNLEDSLMRPLGLSKYGSGVSVLATKQPQNARNEQRA